jgi:hypothetical protein
MLARRVEGSGSEERMGCEKFMEVYVTVAVCGEYASLCEHASVWEFMRLPGGSCVISVCRWEGECLASAHECGVWEALCVRVFTCPCTACECMWVCGYGVCECVRIHRSGWAGVVSAVENVWVGDT